MKILFTGASSFSGMWFVKELAECGHEVTACFRLKESAYYDIRKARVAKVLEYCQPVFECSFGSETFIKTIENNQEWNLFCHHAAEVHNYKDPDFDAISAASKNTHNIKAVLSTLSEKGCQKVVLTGSVFEPREGAGSDNLRAVSPYGLSKGLTTETFRFYCAVMGLRLGKFVISNPFGPYEEIKFTTSLIQTWAKNQEYIVSSPEYVRDNIHISLLSKAYRSFCHRLTTSPGFEKYNPSGYVETQGAFTARFSHEMQARLGLPCKFSCSPQIEFSEPKVRINLDALNPRQLEWDENLAWDTLAAYYKQSYLK